MYTNFKLAAAVLLLVICLSCQTSRQQQVTPIKRIKEISRDTSSFAPEKVGENEYTVEGYFFKDPVPILVTDLKWVQINSPMPDSVFIVLGGAILDSFNRNPERYQGSYIRIRGRIIARENSIIQTDSIRFNADFNPTNMLQVVRPRTSGIVLPQKHKLCSLFPRICVTSVAASKNYALLYSGGINIYNAHSRYWNDLKFMYNTLKSQYGYGDDQIVVVYKDGRAEDEEMKVDYPANVIGLNSAIAYLQTRLSGRQDLFLFVTNHGGGYNESEGRNVGGVSDEVGGDEIDNWRYDETVYYYNEVSNEMTDDEFASKINSLAFHRLLSVLEPCFSGGLLYDLRGIERVIISAASEFEYSWSGAPGDHDMFSYYFTAALNKATHNGNPVNADTNGDGRISFLEAFIFARDNDTASESPHLEDSGDGVGTKTPVPYGGTDGGIADNSFLN